MYRITLNRVRDSVKVVEKGDSLILTVDADATQLVSALNRAKTVMDNLNKDTSREDGRDAALMFGASVFGEEQARKLLEFYHGDASCVVEVTGRYLSERLVKRIARVQKRAR